VPELFLKEKKEQWELDLPTQELSSISVNTVAPCQYVTNAAFWNLAGIQDNEIT
jgi:hypothetical protein